MPHALLRPGEGLQHTSAVDGEDVGRGFSRPLEPENKASQLGKSTRSPRLTMGTRALWARRTRLQRVRRCRPAPRRARARPPEGSAGSLQGGCLAGHLAAGLWAQPGGAPDGRRRGRAAGGARWLEVRVLGPRGGLGVPQADRAGRDVICSPGPRGGVGELLLGLWVALVQGCHGAPRGCEAATALCVPPGSGVRASSRTFWNLFGTQTYSSSPSAIRVSQPALRLLRHPVLSDLVLVQVLTPEEVPLAPGGPGGPGGLGWAGTLIVYL